MAQEQVIEALVDLEHSLALLQRSVQALRQALTEDLAPPGPDGETPVRRALRAVADYYGTTVADLLSPSRRREVMRPRQVAMYLLHTRLRLSYHTIGTLLHRDHSTIVYGVRQVQGHEDIDKLLELFGGLLAP